MSNFTSLFDIVRGRDERSIIDESFQPMAGYVPTCGDIVEVVNDAGVPKIQLLSMPRLDDAANLAALAALLASPKVAWTVETGMQANDFSGRHTGKSVCRYGVMMTKTDRFEDGDTYAPGTKVTVVNGIVRANPVGGTAHRQVYGEVIEVAPDNSYLIINVIR